LAIHPSHVMRIEHRLFDNRAGRPHATVDQLHDRLSGLFVHRPPDGCTSLEVQTAAVSQLFRTPWHLLDRAIIDAAIAKVMNAPHQRSVRGTESDSRCDFISALRDE
jgi:hypothetical protein